MNDQPSRHPMTLTPVCVQVPGMEAIEPRRGLRASEDDQAPTFDLYLPAGIDSLDGTPAVVLVCGYPEAGLERVLGCRFGQMRQIEDWARLLAASGMAAVCPSAQVPTDDLLAVLRSLRLQGAVLGLWACSGHVPLALYASTLLGAEVIRGAALCYGYTCDLDGGTEVATAAAQFGFVAPGLAPGSLDPSRPDRTAPVPLLLVRAGTDEMPGLNDAMDRFIAHARRCGHPLERHDLPGAPHAFDLQPGTPDGRRAVRRILRFLRESLSP